LLLSFTNLGALDRTSVFHFLHRDPFFDSVVIYHQFMFFFGLSTCGLFFLLTFSSFCVSTSRAELVGLFIVRWFFASSGIAFSRMFFLLLCIGGRISDFLACFPYVLPDLFA
jgi:hypothetical protein